MALNLSIHTRRPSVGAAEMALIDGRNDDGEGREKEEGAIIASQKIWCREFIPEADQRRIKVPCLLRVPIHPTGPPILCFKFTLRFRYVDIGIKLPI
jgi:hypothetical protein